MGVDQEWLSLGEDAATRARERWAGLRNADGEFLAHWANLRGAPERALAHGEEVFVAFESGRACAAAIRILETHFFNDARRTIRRLCAGRLSADDAQQSVWERLLTGTRPKILSYSGEGPLGHWLRSVAQRSVFNDLRGKRPRLTELRDWEATQPTSPCVYEGALHENVVVVLQAALDRAFQGLNARERELLTLHYVRRLTLPELSRSLGMHRATMARWLSTARLRVFEAAVHSTMTELELSRDEAQALWQERYSELEALESTPPRINPCDAGASRVSLTIEG